MAKSEKKYFCPVNATLDIIAGKWKPSILCEINEGPRRFSDLRRALPVSEKVLAADLKALEADGVVARREFLDGGVHATEYSFTEFGETLRPALVALAHWGLEHRKPGRSPAT